MLHQTSRHVPRFCSPFPDGSCELYGCYANEEQVRAKITLIQSFQGREQPFEFGSEVALESEIITLLKSDTLVQLSPAELRQFWFEVTCSEHTFPWVL